MKVDAYLLAAPPQAAAAAAQLETAGFDGAFSSEGAHDPFIPLAVAASATTHIELGTSVAIAFARSPMTVASAAWDLHLLSGGRMVLGLGTQVKPHIERRFSMPWSHPARRMREFVLALRAIWESWQNGSPLAFDGEFYRHTLMTPAFSPGPSPYGPPPVLVAAVGEAMTRVAAEVGDGLLAHPFSSPTYLREVTLPAVRAGLEASSRSRGEFEIALSTMVATGTTPAKRAASVEALRSRLAFYASTPAYRPVLAVHGWEGLHEPLKSSARSGDWAGMSQIVTDEMVEAVGVVGEPSELAQLLVERAAVADRLSLVDMDDSADPGRFGPLITALKTSSRSGTEPAAR